MGIKGAIFDIDGVIVNTVPFHFRAWRKMFEDYGHAFTMEDYLLKVDGRPRLEGASAILTELGPKEIAAAGEKKQGYYLELLDKEPLEVFETTVKMIKELKRRGVRLAAASSSKNAVRILNKIDLLNVFEVNVSGADFKKGKPDPEIFLTASERLGLKPSECVVFEDAMSGIEAAKRGGFFSVGIDRHKNAEGLNGADILVNDLGELAVDEIMKLGERS